MYRANDLNKHCLEYTAFESITLVFAKRNVAAVAIVETVEDGDYTTVAP